MVDFAHSYSPPGVYIDEDETTLVGAVGIPSTLVALVGPAQGYQVNIEQFPLNATAVRLTKQGIDLTSVTVTNALTGAVVPATNYTATATSDPGQAYFVDVVRAGAATVVVDTVVNVSYQYTVPDYYTPHRIDNFEDVKTLYGEPLNFISPALGDTGYQYITSPLTLAAQIALENGASEIVCVATAPPGSGATTAAQKSTARASAITTALATISTNYAINIVVPVTEGVLGADAPSVLTAVRAHVESSSASGYFRFSEVGFDPAVSTAPDALLATASIKSKRVQLVYSGPAGLNLYSGAANNTFPVGHQYLAAAFAGRRSALTAENSLTKQTITSFSGVAGTPLSNSLKNQYAASGVGLTEVDRFGRMVVRHDITTDNTSVNTRETAVVRARDSLVTLLDTGTSDSGLIGVPVDDSTVLSVKSAVAGLLEFGVNAGLIVGYTDLQARLTSSDPSIIEVKFAYRPAYPLNYILISFSVDLSTGRTDLVDTAA